MDKSKIILSVGLLAVAIALMSYGLVQTVYADYGVAGNKLKQKAQEIQNKANIPEPIKDQLSAALHARANQLLNQCANASPSYPCG
jgi:hypothetical protein